MPIAPKPTPTATVNVSREFPIDLPLNDAGMQKWYWDLKSVLLRNCDLLEAVVNQNSATGTSLVSQLAVVNASLQVLITQIAALTTRVTALENAPATTAPRWLVTNADVANGAAIAEAKLALNWPTTNPAFSPTPHQKDALVGTAGAPSTGNPFVSSLDPRLGAGENGDVLSWLGL